MKKRKLPILLIFVQITQKTLLILKKEFERNLKYTNRSCCEMYYRFTGTFGIKKLSVTKELFR